MFKNKKAFTIIELIVVIAVLGILVLLGMPRLSGYIEKSQVTVIRHDIRVAENKMSELLINGNTSFLNENKESDWGDYISSDKLKGLINEDKLYEKEGPGLVDKNTVDELDLSKYKIIPPSLKKEIKTKLPGEFYADAGGKVYYERDKAGNIVSNEKCATLYKIENQGQIDKLMALEYIFTGGEMPPTETVSDLVSMLTMMGAEIKFYNYNATDNYLKAEASNPMSGETMYLVFDLEDSTKVYILDGNGEDNTLDIDIDCLNKILDIKPVEFDGEMFTYDFNQIDKEATITGFTNEYIAISPTPSNKGTIVFPKVKVYEEIEYDVVAIGEFAFSASSEDVSKNYINSIEIPENIIRIGEGAFYYNSLSELVIHDKVIDIGNRAFSDNQLTKVNIGKGLTEIRNEVFSGNSISSIIIPNNIVKIGEDAFAGNELSKLVIPTSVVNIESGAFTENKITDLVIPNNVIKLGSSSFSRNELKTLIIGHGITELDSYVFSNNKLLTVNIPNNIIEIRSNAFSTNLLSSVNLPSNLEFIGESAFASNKIKTITIPSKVVSIGNASFMSSGLESVIFEGFISPESSKLTSIGKDAFFNNSLSSIKIPKTVTSIGLSALQRNNLEEVYMPANISGQTGRYAIINDEFGTYYGYQKDAGVSAGLYIRTGDSPWFWTKTE